VDHQALLELARSGTLTASEFSERGLWGNTRAGCSSLLVILALVVFALLWRWTTPTNPVPHTPDDYRAERDHSNDPIADQSRQEQVPWIGGSGG
jgi:hypothetical protein